VGCIRKAIGGPRRGNRRRPFSRGMHTVYRIPPRPPIARAAPRQRESPSRPKTTPTAGE
jgi:hypothetical protein